MRRQSSVISVILPLFVLSLLLAIRTTEVDAAVWFTRGRDPKNPCPADPAMGNSVDARPGDAWRYRVDQCARCVCTEYGTECMSCGVLAGYPRERCHLRSDMSKPYPECCPRPVCSGDPAELHIRGVSHRREGSTGGPSSTLLTRLLTTASDPTPPVTRAWTEQPRDLTGSTAAVEEMEN